MKYSILMPYMKRNWHLHNTLVSYYHYYKNRNDYEVVIVEDIKNYNDETEHRKLLTTLLAFKDKVPIKLIHSDFENCYNPSPLFNLGARASEGEYIVVTNPEVFHFVNILEGADNILKENPDIYLVCGCVNGIEIPHYIPSFDDFTYKLQAYYQHSKYRNALFHFCSIISKKRYDSFGGFDERFANGIAFDDDDFRDTIIKNNIRVFISDSLLTIHQNHDNAFDIPDYNKRLQRNQFLHLLKVQNKTDEQIKNILKEAEK